MQRSDSAVRHVKGVVRSAEHIGRIEVVDTDIETLLDGGDAIGVVSIKRGDAGDWPTTGATGETSNPEFPSGRGI